jgi:DNA-binding response OmpR family regulator
MDLGCRVTACRFDLGDLDEEDLERRPPTIVLLDAGDELQRAVLARRKLDDVPPVADTPTLLVVTLPRLAGLDFSLGFDDFTLRPIVPAELYGRLRQLDWRTAAFGSEETIKIGDLVIDLAGYEVSVAGRRLDLTHQEFELLRFLAQNRGRVFTRDQLLQKVWGYQYAGGSRTVDIHVRRLRAKLGPVQSGIITTIRHVGYKMKSGTGKSPL